MTKITASGGPKGDKDVTSKSGKGGSPERKKAKESFGVRSYLHQFYQSPTREDIESSEWFLLPQTGQSQRGLYACRALTIIGFLFLIVGAATIIISYSWPRKSLEEIIPAENRNGNEIIISRDMVAEIRSDPMRLWKIIGLGIFTFGGVVMAVSLLIPTLANCFGPNSRLAALRSQAQTPGEPPIKIFADETETTEVPKSPVEKKVPVMEAIAKVQPGEGERERKLSGDELLLASSED